MDSGVYFEDVGDNGTGLDPSNQSLDPVPDLIFSINRRQIENIQDPGNPFDQPLIKAVLLFLYSTIFLLSFFGNLAVVLVTTLHWRMRKTATFCLFNLAIANLCVGIFCVYQNLWLFLMESWIFGNFMCKMYYFIMSLSYTASILILVVIAIERYVVIMHPFEGRRLMTIGKLQLIIVLVWTVSGVISFHRFYSVSISKNSLPGGGVEIICSPNVLLHNHKPVDLANFLFLFLLPLTVICVLYTRVGFYLKRHSVLRSETLNVTPPSTARSSVEIETVDRAAENLAPVAGRSGPITNKMTVASARHAQVKRSAEIAGPSRGTGFIRCSSTKQGSPACRVIETRGLKRSHSWTDSNGRTHLSCSNKRLRATSWILQVESRGLLMPTAEFKEGQQLHRGFSSSNLVRNYHGGEDCGLSSVDKISVADRSDSLSNSDPTQMDCGIQNREVISKRTLMRRSQMENNCVALTRLNFSRRLSNIIQCGKENYCTRFLCCSGAQTSSRQLRQPNANHKAVIRMLVVIVITFALCNFPFHMRKMCQNYFAPCELDHPLFDLATPATFLIMYANCAINPFIYAIMNRRFRACLMELLSRGCRRIERRH